MNPNSITTWKFLAPNPKSAYKQLFLKDRRIRARDLYGIFMSAEEPMTPAEIAADYDLPLAAVEEAIAYCQTDPPEIKEDYEREERIMNRITSTAANIGSFRSRSECGLAYEALPG